VTQDCGVVLCCVCNYTGNNNNSSRLAGVLET